LVPIAEKKLGESGNRVPICCKSLFCTDGQKFYRIPEEPHFKGTPVET